MNTVAPGAPQRNTQSHHAGTFEEGRRREASAFGDQLKAHIQIDLKEAQCAIFIYSAGAGPPVPAAPLALRFIPIVFNSDKQTISTEWEEKKRGNRPHLCRIKHFTER